MKKNVVILIVEDNAGHLELVKRNLLRSCIDNEILHFKDGQEILDFLFGNGSGKKRAKDQRYLLLLDIRLPKVDGREVLRRIKEDEELRKIPVIILTTADDAGEVEQCYKLACSFYMVKPTNYIKFMAAVESLGFFLSLDGIRIPPVDGELKSRVG